jgi:iron(III) transport system ATP-binding protein
VTKHSGRCGTVLTTDGVLIVDNVVDLQDGDQCVVSIRPEQIRVMGDTTGTGPNMFAGTVLTRLFTGECMDYQIQLGNDTIRCRTPASQRYSTGKPITVSMPSEHCIALRRNTIGENNDKPA